MSTHANSKPEITATNTIAKTRLFNVEAVDLRFSNGERRTFERLQRPHASSVMVVPITANNEFILIREYAVGIEDYELTFPKGFLEKDEAPEIGANRELKEEIGYGAEQLQLLHTMHSSPAYMQSKMYVLLARELYAEKLVGDEPEPLEIIYWPLKNYRELLQHPEFISSHSIAALFLAKEVLSID